MKDFLEKSNYFYQVRLDQEYNIIENNKLLQQHCAFLKKKIKGLSFSELVYYRDFNHLEEKLNELLLSGGECTIDLRKVNTEGTDFNWTRWEFSKTQNGNEVGFSGIGHPIQKNEKTVQFPPTLNDLHAKNDLMEGILEDNLIGFWLWDIRKKEDNLSLSLVELLGYQPDEKNNYVKWKKHIHPNDRQKVDELLKKHFESQGQIPFHCEFRIKNLHKKDIWVLGYGKVLQWASNLKPVMMAGCFFDISEKKKSEALIEEQSNFLKTLSFNQSHLMRAKLANIIGILDIIDPKKPVLENGHFLKMIKKEAKKLDEILKKNIANTSQQQERVIEQKTA